VWTFEVGKEVLGWVSCFIWLSVLSPFGLRIGCQASGLKLIGVIVAMFFYKFGLFVILHFSEGKALVLGGLRDWVVAGFFCSHFCNVFNLINLLKDILAQI
jgi:hypothetical protein